MVRSVSSDQLLGQRYRVIKVLGESQRGCTLQVEDTHQDGQQRVIRQLRLPFTQAHLQERAYQLCQQEFDFLQRLQHPQVPHFYDFFQWEQENEHWLAVVQDYIPGPTLRQWLGDRAAESSTLTEREAIKLLQQVLNGLGYIHTQGVIHRHISPDNLIRRPEDGRLVLIDFGGMKHTLGTIWAESLGDRTTHQTLTDHCGTLDYAPLEQVRKGIIYTYSDIYAIAATLMLALTGEPPATYRQPQTGAWDWSASPLENAQLQEILAQMLAKRPSDRPQNVQGIVQALRHIPHKALPPEPIAQSEPQAIETTVATPLELDPQNQSPVGQWLVRSALGIGFVMSAGAIGWGIGQAWVHQQVPEPETVAELELSPDVTLTNTTETQSLDFPLVDDGEPDPDPTFSETETARKLSLRDQRRQLGIDYDFFRGLVEYIYWQDYPARSGVLPTVASEDTAIREQWDTIALRLLQSLGSLSGESRRRLGRYSRHIPSQWQQDLQRLNVPMATLEMLTATTFSTYFPDRNVDDHPVLRQLWNAIAFDHVLDLRQPNRVEVLNPSANQEQTIRADDLDPQQSKIYTVDLTAGQLLIANLVSDYSTTLAVQTPDGELLLEPGRDRLWSGTVKQPGKYTLTIMSLAQEVVNYQLYVTVNEPPE